MAQTAYDLQILFDLLDSHSIECCHFQVRLIRVGLPENFATVYQEQGQTQTPESPRQDPEPVEGQPRPLDIARLHDDVDVLQDVVHAVEGPRRDVDQPREAIRVARHDQLHALDLEQRLEQAEHLSGLLESVRYFEVIVRDDRLVIPQVKVGKQFACVLANFDHFVPAL